MPFLWSCFSTISSSFSFFSSCSLCGTHRSFVLLLRRPVQKHRRKPNQMPEITIVLTVRIYDSGQWRNSANLARFYPRDAVPGQLPYVYSRSTRFICAIRNLYDGQMYYDKSHVHIDDRDGRRRRSIRNFKKNLNSRLTTTIKIHKFHFTRCCVSACKRDSLLFFFSSSASASSSCFSCIAVPVNHRNQATR